MTQEIKTFLVSKAQNDVLKKNVDPRRFSFYVRDLIRKDMSLRGIEWPDDLKSVGGQPKENGS